VLEISFDLPEQASRRIEIGDGERREAPASAAMEEHAAEPAQPQEQTRPEAH